MTVSSAHGINAMLYRFELVDGALVRGRPGDVQPHVDRKRCLVDVLLNEDETGRYIAGTRGFIVVRQDMGVADPAQDLQHQRTFEVGAEFLLAISKDLSVGPRLQPAPKLATSDGQHVA